MVCKAVEYAAESELLFAGVSDCHMWMSHGDRVTTLPEGFVKIARSDNCEYAAIANVHKSIFGLQFHPEVTHSEGGKQVLRNFLVGLCKAPEDWDMKSISDEFIKEVREKVGPEGHVIGAVSGGVDSTVAAVLLHRAIGDRFHAIMVDNACLRKNESKRVVKRLKEQMDINLTVVDASEQFLSLLEGVSEPEKKRKIIGNTFIQVFQEEAKKIPGKVDFLLQGTLYPDVIESVSYRGPSATIKTHHNVGGLPATMHLKLIEPLRELFKDEVRELGVALGIDAESVWRHPFPGPGLAIRVLGEVTKERLDILREADDVLVQEITAAGVYDSIGQAFVVLLPVKSVGVMGDGRTYEQVCAIRCVTSSDFMTADWYRMDYDLLGRIATRIINEVRGINRVCYDVSSKPPATIEWE
jgi:GMP synthase (glutamine-hydrolysing)